MNTTNSILPKLLILSLEYTLLPYEFERNIAWPCNVTNGTLIDSNGTVIEIFHATPRVLEWIKKSGIPLVVTYNKKETNGANQIIKFFGWDKYFTLKLIYPDTKTGHFKNIHINEVTFDEMIFFDSDWKNVKEVEDNLGVFSKVVISGLTTRFVQRTIEEYGLEKRKKIPQSE